MAKLADILNVERQRSEPAERKVVHLFPEGSFLRAYEWSAWLCCRFISDFKVTKRALKGTNDTLVLIGFPQTSLEKFTPNDSEVVPNESDGSIGIILADSLFKDEPVPTDFDNWKQSVPMAEQRSKKTLNLAEILSGTTNPQSRPNQASLTGIVRSIAVFPLERSSPFECMEFIAELKQQIASIM